MIDYTGIFEKVAGRSNRQLLEGAINAAHRGVANKAFAHRISNKASRLTTGERNKLTHIYNRGNQLATAADNRFYRLTRPNDGLFGLTHIDDINKYRKAKTTVRDAIKDKADVLISSGFTKKDLHYIK